MTENFLDTALAEVKAEVDARGWRMVSVPRARGVPQHSYSLGFWYSWGHPEIVVPGLDEARAGHMLGVIADRVAAGEKLEPAVPADLGGVARTSYEGISYAGIAEDGRLVRFYPAAAGHRLLTLALSRRFYGFAVPFLRLAWPDAEGRFPGDPGFSPLRERLQDVTW